MSEGLKEKKGGKIFLHVDVNEVNEKMNVTLSGTKGQIMRMIELSIYEVARTSKGDPNAIFMMIWRWLEEDVEKLKSQHPLMAKK